MRKILSYPVKVLHSVYLVVIFPLMFTACGLAWCIRYKLFCGVKEFCKIWKDAIKDVWSTA